MLNDLHTFLCQYHAFDFSSILGLLATLVGFFFTVKALLKTRNKVNQIIKKMKTVDVFSELSSILDAIGDLKSLHLSNNLDGLPRCCTEIKRRLITLRGVYPQFTLDESSVIQSSIVFFNGLENRFILIRHRESTAEEVIERNQMLNKHMDELLSLLVRIKNDIAGGKNA